MDTDTTILPRLIGLKFLNSAQSIRKSLPSSKQLHAEYAFPRTRFEARVWLRDQEDSCRLCAHLRSYLYVRDIVSGRW